MRQGESSESSEPSEPTESIIRQFAQFAVSDMLVSHWDVVAYESEGDLEGRRTLARLGACIVVEQALHIKGLDSHQPCLMRLEVDLDSGNALMQHLAVHLRVTH